MISDLVLLGIGVYLVRSGAGVSQAVGAALIAVGVQRMVVRYIP